MQQVQIIHNPGAGDESHSREQLTMLLQKYGYQCDYVSTDQAGWKNFDTRADIILIAGGDGTVKKVARQLLGKKLLDKVNRISLLPLGTANNVSRSLGVHQPIEEVIQHWYRDNIKSFDAGRIYNVSGAKFFLESFGFGIFPALIRDGEKGIGSIEGSPEEKMQMAVKQLHRVAKEFKPVYGEFEVDGTTHSGKYLLLEITNTPTIGPNLEISPDSDPGDGTVEIVCVSGEQKDQFLDFLEKKISNQPVHFSFDTIKGQHIKIRWQGNKAHVDDELLRVKKDTEVEIRVKKGLLDFLVP